MLFLQATNMRSSLKNTFTSDAYNGIHPTILEAIITANQSYAHENINQKVQTLFKEHFGSESNTFFVCTGTAANVLGLSTMLKPYQGIICADYAHLHVDERGAPEHYLGSKLLVVQSENGKIAIKDIQELYMNETYAQDCYKVQPKVILITQPTEYGAVYTAQEIKKLTDFAHNNGMLVHMDGARLAIAAAYLNTTLAALSKDVGIDVLSFGGTKQGMMMGDAVIFFNKELARDFEAIQIQGMQRASKMHFIEAQFIALLSNELWLKNAQHANTMASLLAQQLSGIPGITISKPVQSNAVFAIMDPQIIERLQKRYFFYIWSPAQSEVRFITSWNTSEKDITDFAAFVTHVINAQESNR